MKNITFAFLMAVALFSVGCKKNTDPPADQTTANASASLIVGTYTATAVAGSNINNATDWADLTKTGAREVLTIKADHTFNSVTSNPITGATSAPINGTWSLSADGLTLSYVGIQDYTIAELSSTRFIAVLKGPNKLANADAAVYNYYRFSYSRQ